MHELEHHLEILLKTDESYSVLLFRTKDLYITRLQESSLPLVAELACSTGQFLYFQAQMLTTTSFSHGITAILESPVFCSLVARWQF